MLEVPSNQDISYRRLERVWFRPTSLQGSVQLLSKKRHDHNVERAEMGNGLQSDI